MPRNGTPSRNHREKNSHEIEPTKLDIDQLTAIVESQLKIGDTKSALFWAEKRMAVQSFNNSGKPSLYEIAQYLKILRSAGEWKTLCTYIVNRDLHFRHLVFSYFYVTAMHQLSKFEEIVALPLGHLRTWENVPVIIPDTVAIVFAERNCKITDEDLISLDKMLKDEQLESRLLYLLADTYLALQNRTSAAACIQYSIKMNPLSSEAVTFALKSHLLPIKKIRETLDSCKNIKAEDKPLMDVIYLLLDYHSKEVQDTETRLKVLEKSLATDLSIQTAKALRLYSTGYISDAFEITDNTISKYGFQESCLLIHIGCLVEMKKMVQIYELSHKLVEMEPDRELTYYAIGCYYYIAEQYAAARKFFHKSVSINPNFGYGWLAHGHALSYDKEHEQAMNCYLRASRLLQNFAEPLLYTGMEYCHANNTKQAEDNIHRAASFCYTPNAVILHELGTVHLLTKSYDRAIMTFLKALMALTKIETDDPIRDLEALLDPILDEFWVPLYFNLGYSMFKVSKPRTAITFYRKVLQMGHQKANAWAQIGFCYSQAGRPRLALNAFMQSLALNPNIASVKHAYDKTVSIVAQLPSTYLDKEPIDVIESLENYPPYKPDKFYDNRPNLGRFMLDNYQLSKLTPEQVFNEHRSNSKANKTPPSPGTGSSPRARCVPDLNDPRPSTAPAAISTTVDPHAWVFRGRVIAEESTADIEAFEGEQPPGVRDRETASAEAVMTGRRDSTEDDLLNAMNFDEDLTVRSQYPLNVVVQDPQELFTDWFMSDIHNDTVRRVYDDVSTLRPPPIPRRRDLALNEYVRGDIPSYLRSSVLRNARMRGRGRGRT